MKFPISIPFILFILSGCASTHEKFYQPLQNPKDPRFLSLQASEEVRVQRVENLETEIQNYLARNYALIGQSAFNGEYEDEKKVKDFARKNGVAVVLLAVRHTSSSTTTVPLLMPNSTTQYHSGTMYGYGGIGAYSGTTTSYGNVIVPLTTTHQRYDQVAVYLMPMREKPRVGIHFRNLTVPERKVFESNTGIMVTAVVDGTPAFHANILQGDVLTEWNGRRLASEDDFRRELTAVQTGSHRIEITHLRRGLSKKTTLDFK